MSEPTWPTTALANPHDVADKARRVQRMFAAIAPSYDLNNRLHSLGRDQAWRRAAVKLADVKPGDIVLDVACGTGDLAMAFAATRAEMVIGIDFTFDMLRLAQRKRRRRHMTRPISYHAADAMRLPVADSAVDVVSIAFGIRNVAQPAVVLTEFFRVLRPGGRVVVLEFSLPRSRLLRALYNVYFNRIMPTTATAIARDRTGAYRYLPRSVNTFLDRPQTIQLLNETGFTRATAHGLTLGIATAYRAVKPDHI